MAIRHGEQKGEANRYDEPGAPTIPSAFSQNSNTFCCYLPIATLLLFADSNQISCYCPKATKTVASTAIDRSDSTAIKFHSGIR